MDKVKLTEKTIAVLEILKESADSLVARQIADERPELLNPKGVSSILTQLVKKGYVAKEESKVRYTYMGVDKDGNPKEKSSEVFSYYSTEKGEVLEYEQK